MRFRDAKKLHNEDEVTVKKTGEVRTVLKAYVIDDPLFAKAVIVECDDGNSYHHTEVR